MKKLFVATVANGGPNKNGDVFPPVVMTGEFTETDRGARSISMGCHTDKPGRFDSLMVKRTAVLEEAANVCERMVIGGRAWTEEQSVAAAALFAAAGEIRALSTDNEDPMIATLTFNLPEDQEAFDAAMEGQRARIALSEIRTHLRNKLKYGDLSEEAGQELREVQTILFASTEGLDL